MVNASISRLIWVFPVPVTEFRHTLETDIIKIAPETILSTGVAALIKIGSELISDRISFVNSCAGMKITNVDPALKITIRFMSVRTCDCNPCPIIFDTMVLAVAANAQIKIP